jgi:hypothetical protein
MRWLGIIMNCGAALCLAGIGIGAILGKEPILAVFLTGFVISGVTLLFTMYRGLPCPRCRRNLGTLVLRHGAFRVHKEIRFCPFCGYALDEDLAEPPVAE